MSSPTTPTRFRALILIGACVGVLGFAGCGGSDDSSSSTPSAPEVATGPTGAEGTDGEAALEQELRDQFAASGDFTDEQIDCIIEGLNGDQFTGEDGQALIDAGGDSSQVPSDTADKIQDVVTDCK